MRKVGGASLTETILVLPLLIAIVLGAIQIAHLYTSYQIVEYSAIVAARSAMVYPPKMPSDPIQSLDELLNIFSGNATNYAKVVMTAKVAAIPATPAGNFITNITGYLDDQPPFDALTEAINSVVPQTTIITKAIYSLLATWVQFEKCEDDKSKGLVCEPLKLEDSLKANDRVRVTVYYIYDLRIPFIRRVFAEIYYWQLAEKVIKDVSEQTGFSDLKEEAGGALDVLDSILSWVEWLSQPPLDSYLPKDVRDNLDKLKGLRETLAQILEGNLPEEKEDLLFTLDDLIDSRFDTLMDIFETLGFYPIVLKATAGTVVMPRAHFEKGSEEEGGEAT